MPSSRSPLRVPWILPAAFLAAGLATAIPGAAGAAGLRVDEPETAVTERTLATLSAASEAASGVKIWVYFTDKNLFDERSYERRIEEVAAEFDPHARARRAKVFKGAPADFHDIPVHEEYVTRLEELGVSVLRRSRWLNAVSGRASLETWRRVADLPFLRKLTPVGRGASSRSRPSETATPPAGRGGLDYGPSFDQLDEIRVVAAHDAGWTGAGVRIAMLDTGYYRDHAAFAQLIAEGRLLAQYDFINDDGETQDEPGDPEGQHFHGTVTWSIAGGFDEGELIGAAYGADFLLAKTEDTSMEAPIEEDNWVAGMEWADGLGADVISSSLGYFDWYTYEDLDGNTAVTTIGADVAAGRGIVVCTAAGNMGTQDWFYIIAPADADSVVTVGGTEPDGSMWLDSSHGPTYDGRTKPEVVARGSQTYGATPPEDQKGEGYRSFQGTSVSTPLVAGAAALLLEAFPAWTPMMVREALMMTADNAANPDNHRGWGRIDVIAALEWAAAVPDGDDLARNRPILRVAPNPLASSAILSFATPVEGPALLDILTAGGRRLDRVVVADPSRPFHWRAVDAAGAPLSPGVYLIRVTGGERSSPGAKLVLSR